MSYNAQGYNKKIGNAHAEAVGHVLSTVVVLHQLEQSCEQIRCVGEDVMRDVDAADDGECSYHAKPRST